MEGEAVKRIPLTEGRFALVDDCDYDALNKHKWHYSAVGYARRVLRVSECGYLNGRLYMHRAILNAQKGQEVDHINFDKLDNRRCNIRIASSRQNKCHKPKPRHNTSGVKGVNWNKGRRRWVARISVAVGQSKTIGYFRDKDAACAARSAAAEEHYGEFNCV